MGKPAALPLLPTTERIVRFGAYGLCILAFVVSVAILAQAHAVQKGLDLRVQAASDQLKQVASVGAAYRSLVEKAADYEGQGIDISDIRAAYIELKNLISDGRYAEAAQLIITQNANLKDLKQAKDAADARKGTLEVTVGDGTAALAGVTVVLQKDGVAVETAVTESAGIARFVQDAGSYSLAVSLSGYGSQSKDGVAITAQSTEKQEITLVKTPAPTPAPTPGPTPRPTSTPRPATPTPVPTPTSRDTSTSYSAYRHTTVQTSAGTFTADIMTFDLASGHIQVKEDTAADGDCTDNCPVKSVLAYVQQNGGFAGINGSYFCPTAYPDCAGKTNSFYWKQYNSRLQKMINAGNGLGDQDPFIVFEENGHATFLRHWADYAGSGIPAYAGISCAPPVVLGGQYAVDDSVLDDKQRTAKAPRAAIGLKGQTLYAVVIQSATVPDLGRVMQALGVDNAMNTDAGGSTGMVYQNSYKLGPGRSVPNALIFVER